MFNPRSMFWRLIRRNRGRLAFAGAVFAAAGVFQYARLNTAEGIVGWAEAAAWAAGTFLFTRWLLKKTFDAAVNYVASGAKEITERTIK